MHRIPIERRAFKNTAVGGIAFLVTMAQTILLVPILLRHWGNDTYGLWLALMAGFTLLQTLDRGHQNYVGNQLNVQYHTDPDEFRRTLGSGIRIAGVLGAVELAVALSLIATGTLSHFLGVSLGSVVQHGLAAGLLTLMTSWLVFGSAGGIVMRLLIPTGMLYEGQWFGIALAVAHFAAIALVSISGGGILAAAIAYSVVQATVSLGVLRYIRVKLPQLYPWWEAGHWRTGVQNLRKALVLTVISVVQQLSNSGLILLVSGVFASATIPVFATLRTLTNTAGAVTTIFINALFPDMIRFQATRDAAKLSDVFATHWFVSGAIVNVGIVLVLPVIEPIYRFWTKGILPFNPVLFFLMAAAISLSNFGAALNVYLHGINDLHAQTVVTIARTASVLLIGYFLSGYLGIISVGVGLVVAELLASMFFPMVFVNRRLGELSARLDLGHTIVASAPPVLLLFASMLLLVRQVSFGTISLLLFPLFVLAYYWNWTMLGSNVKTRVRALASSKPRQ